MSMGNGMDNAIAYPLTPESASELVRASVAAGVTLPAPRRSGTAAFYALSGDCDPLAEDCVCTIGAFDGIHNGHRYLVADTVADAREWGCRSLVVTFDPDPGDVLAPDKPARRLLSCADRLRLLSTLGVDGIVAFPFDSSLQHTGYEPFVLDVLLGACRAVSIHVGSDFRMGDRNAGDVAAIAEVGAAHGIAVHGIELLSRGGERLSATRIRRLLLAGELDQATALLGRCHYVRGRVEHGRGEGTSFGFPTANVACDPADCMPAEGVYACFVRHGGRAWPAAVNVGAPPTFSDGPRPSFLEANLIGFEGDLYGSDVAVTFVRWLRDSRSFDSLDELESTVLGNIAWVRDCLGKEGIRINDGEVER